MTRNLWVWVGLCAVVLCACTFKREDHPSACGGEKRCGSNEECVDGFCVTISQSMNRNDAGGSDSGGNAGTGGGRMDASTQPDASGQDSGKRPG